MFFLLLSHDHNTYHRRFRDTWRKWAKEVTRPFAFQPKALEMFENQYKSELLIRSHPRGRGFESLQVHQTRKIRTYFRLEKGSDFSFSSGLRMKAPVDGVKLRYLVIDRKPITRFGGYDYEVR